MAKNKNISQSITPPQYVAPHAPATEKKGCGCTGGHGHAYEVPEPYLHTDGNWYLWKIYVITDQGVQLPAKQIFKLAAGEQLCEDCLADYPILAGYIDAERMDNGKAKSLVERMFSIKTPLLSLIPSE